MSEEEALKETVAAGLERSSLSDSQIAGLLMAFAAGRKQFTEQEAQAFVKWAQGVCAEAELVKMVIKGELVVSEVIEPGSDYSFRAAAPEERMAVILARKSEEGSE